MHFANQMTISQAVGKHVETYQTNQGECRNAKFQIDHQPVDDATEVTGIASSLSVELAKHRRASKALQFDFISRGKVQQIKCRCILLFFWDGWTLFELIEIEF